MLHRCVNCHQAYLTSDFYDRCDYCGENSRQIELQVDDGVVEWWILTSQANWGIEPERARRWWI